MKFENRVIWVGRHRLEITHPTGDPITLKRKNEPAHYQFAFTQKGYIKGDWSKRLAIQRAMVKPLRPKTFTDLMVGCGTAAAVIIQATGLPPDKVTLNDIDPVMVLNAARNFPGVNILCEDLVETELLVHLQADLVTADFNSFSLSKIEQWDHLLANLRGTKTFMFSDSGLYQFKLPNPEWGERVRLYYEELSDTLRDCYGWVIQWVGFSEGRPGVATVLTQRKKRRGDIKYIAPQTPIPIEVY